MAAQRINLLPKELAVSKEVAKNLDYAKKFTIFAIVVFSVVMAVGGGMTYYFSDQLKKLTEEQNSLKTSITSLESTEQLLLITKDRLAKIESILNTRNNEEIFLSHKTLVDNLPDELSLTGSEIQRGESVLEFTALNSRDLATFMNSLVNNTSFSNIALRGLSFNNIAGYRISLEIN